MLAVRVWNEIQTVHRAELGNVSRQPTLRRWVRPVVWDWCTGACTKPHGTAAHLGGGGDGGVGGGGLRAEANQTSVQCQSPNHSGPCIVGREEKEGMRHAALSPPSKEFAGSLERRSAIKYATRFTTAYLGGGGLGGVGGGGLRAVTAKHCMCMAIWRWQNAGNEQCRLLPLLTRSRPLLSRNATAWAYCWMQAALFPSSRWTCSSTPKPAPHLGGGGEGGLGGGLGGDGGGGLHSARTSRAFSLHCCFLGMDEEKAPERRPRWRAKQRWASG